MLQHGKQVPIVSYKQHILYGKTLSTFNLFKYYVPLFQYMFKVVYDNSWGTTIIGTRSPKLCIHQLDNWWKGKSQRPDKKAGCSTR